MKDRSATTRLLQRGRALSGARNRAHTIASTRLSQHFTGRPPDEPSMLGLALTRSSCPSPEAISGNRRLLPATGGLFVPDRGREHEEAVRGPRKRVMFGVLSFLKQFIKRNSSLSRTTTSSAQLEGRDLGRDDAHGPARDTVLVENTPIDYLIASPVAALGSRSVSTRPPVDRGNHPALGQANHPCRPRSVQESTSCAGAWHRLRPQAHLLRAPSTANLRASSEGVFAMRHIRC